MATLGGMIGPSVAADAVSAAAARGLKPARMSEGISDRADAGGVRPSRSPTCRP